MQIRQQLWTPSARNPSRPFAHLSSTLQSDATKDIICQYRKHKLVQLEYQKQYRLKMLNTLLYRINRIWLMLRWYRVRTMFKLNPRLDRRLVRIQIHLDKIVVGGPSVIFWVNIRRCFLKNDFSLSWTFFIFFSKSILDYVVRFSVMIIVVSYMLYFFYLNFATTYDLLAESYKLYFSL